MVRYVLYISGHLNSYQLDVTFTANRLFEIGNFMVRYVLYISGHPNSYQLDVTFDQVTQHHIIHMTHGSE